jgi:hypothetical protein
LIRVWLEDLGDAALAAVNVDKAFSMARPPGYTNPVVAELRDGECVCLR